MKVEYRSPAGTGSYSVLADEATATLAAAISGFQPGYTKSPMVVAGYGAAVQSGLDLGQASYTLAFSVDRVHASAAAAVKFVLDEMLKFRADLDLKITVGAQVTYYAAGICTQCAPEPHSDQSTKIRYAFSSGNYTTTAP